MRYILFIIVLFISYPALADDSWTEFNRQQQMFLQQEAVDTQILNEMYRSSDRLEAFEEQQRHNKVMEEYAERAERRAQQVEMDKLERKLYPEKFEK